MDVKVWSPFLFVCLLLIPCGVNGSTTSISSGTHNEDTYYIFSCSSGYFIQMASGTYFTCSGDSFSVLTTLQSNLNGQTSKQLHLSDSLFGKNSSGCTATFTASWYCGRNGNWGDWGSWSACTVLCGGNAPVTRSRICNNPSFEYPGSDCSGDATNTMYCNTQACEDDAQLITHRGPWTLVYKAPSGTTVSGYNDFYSHYADSEPGSTLNDNDVAVMRDFSSAGSAYKSSKLLQWQSGITISAVRLSVFKSGKEVAYVDFNALGKGKLDWFNCDNIIGSSYTDIVSSSKNHCGFKPTDTNYKRYFYINALDNGCPGDTGWIMMKDFNSVSGCVEWDPAAFSSPYIKYSTATTQQVWSSGSVSTGDSLAIFIMEWHMVFKGVQGVTPAAGSLVDLWTGTTVENDNDDTKTTITTLPGLTVKSSMVEDWQGYFTAIDMVKYAFFTNGDEKAYVVFNGRGTTKTSWFADGKELYSHYTDIASDTPVTSGITGDSYRKFALIRTSSSCSSFYAWMMVLDVGSSVSCTFDNDVQTRPYFLYSSSTGDSIAQSEGAWYSTGFPAAHTLGIFVSGFYPVMKVARDQSISPASSVYNLWTGTYTLNEFTTSAMSFAASTASYKSSLVDSWNSYYIKAVRVAMYTGSVERAYVVFGAHASDKNSWFDCDRILYTNYQDLNRRTGSFAHCSLAGDSAAGRRFFIEYNDAVCTLMGGWMAVIEGSGCSFDSMATTPYGLYSDTTPGYEYNVNMAIADVFVISIAMDDFCAFSPCTNGGTCYHKGVKYECVCAGDYYGLDCADLDGNFTTWTDWSTCSCTCYAWGTQSRTRTCTNPTPAGPNGLTCTGDSSETQDCILTNLAVCSVYNTGNISVDLSFTMSCPAGLYIFVSTAFYGYASTCYDTDPLSDVRVLCQGKTTNCTITFNDANFGGNPCSGHAVTKYGSATMYCIETLKLSTFQGPWRLVFKAPAETAPPSGHADIADFFLSGDTANDGVESAMTDFSKGSLLYKSSLINEWTAKNKTFAAVRLSIYANNEEVAYVVFDGRETNGTSWMDCSKILYSSFTDIKTATMNYCQIQYHETSKRHFYISANHGGCDLVAGWILFKDYGATAACTTFEPVDGSITLPYIIYSTASTFSGWETSNKAYADSLAIFVQDWHMVFKGVDGVTPTAGNLETLWEGSTTEYNGDETVKTTNNVPAVSYKSAVVEDWSSNWTVIDQVKYAFFSSGEEVAHVVFDGINTGKNTWMDTTNILYSSEYDSVSEATAASISGDGTRTFSVVDETSTCALFSGWMLVLDDSSGSTTCSFDNNVRTRPYFLYSDTAAVGLPESSSSWNSAAFPYADVLGVFIIGWFPVLKVANGESVSPATGIYNLWTGTFTLNEYDSTAYSMSAGTISYKSSLVDSWTSYYFTSVRLSFFVGGQEVAFVVFDAHASSKTSWFSCNRILYTSYVDLTRETTVLHCSVTGDNNRFFFIEEAYGSSCTENFGWFGIVEGSVCSWDSTSTTPFPLYSDAGFCEANDDMAVADTFAISINRDNMCHLISCENGATCYDWGARFQCVCAGDYYGGKCQNLDGGWTAWTAWTSCSTTCYSQGTQTRDRLCTIPTTVGDGIYCPGYSNQTLFCIPTHLDICSSYHTGDIGEGQNYTMACPSAFYIHIHDAYYGASSVPCTTADPISVVRTACHGTTDTCNVQFTDATFGGDPCSSNPSATKAGYIKYFCARSKVLDKPRGPWRLVFKAPRATTPPAGYTDILSLYSASGAYNEGNTAAMTDFSASGTIYKSDILNQWESNVTVTAVKMSVYTGGVETAYVVFDASGKGKSDWFDCTRIIDSNWMDIETGNTTCTLSSGEPYKRIFHISSDYTGCDDETGWIMFKDYGATLGCDSSDSTAASLPYMLYSTATLRATWSSGNKTTGDCFAIFLMDWHMVYRAVAGEQTQGSLETLWTSSTLLNDGLDSAISVTNTPTSGYKSSVVETWSDDFTFIDMVKYAYFTSGVEKAWIVFNGIGTTKTSWFADNNILFSSYGDIKVAGKTTVSVTGDGIRSYAAIYSYSSCAGLTGWMMMSDYGSSTTCSFDNAATKPYFLYSSTDSYGSPESGSTYDSTAFPQADVFGVFIHGWLPVLKVSKLFGVSPASGIYDMWTNTYTVNEYNDSLHAFSFADNTMPYKSSVVDTWSSYYFKAVRLGFFQSGIEKGYVVFDAHGSTKTSWFSSDRILYSSWTDLSRDTTYAYSSVTGHAAFQRYFFMQSSYGTDCTTENGWFSVVERTSGGCSWEQMDSTFPHVVFSDTTTAELNTGMAVADVFAVSVSMDNICDIVECLNNGICLDWGGRYFCSCKGDYYGHLCQNLNGDYTAWTDWTDCSTTCYNRGMHIRNRTCTNPTPTGNGLDCSGLGPADAAQVCVPMHLDICDDYPTGNIEQDSSFIMVCPPDFYIHVYDAFFGNGATCSDSDALADAQTVCHTQTDSCTLTFSTATFGGDPCSGDGLSNYGHATFYCAKSQLLEEWRGPWRLVFKVPKDTAPPAGYADYMSLYTASGPYNEDNTAAMVDFSASGETYKSALLDQLGDNVTVNAIKLSVYKDGAEAGYVVFDATGATKSDWFDCTKIIDSSWHDIVDGNTTCTLNSGGTEKRSFFISSDYTGCASETGWIMMKDYGATTGCSEWDTTAITRPYFYYSGLGTRVQWSSANKVAADTLAIFVLEWHMVFKGIQGVAPTADSNLLSLWTNSQTENEYDPTVLSLTNSPSKVYKSGMVESWSEDFVFVDMVKYSLLSSGTEKAWFVFNGVDSTKTSWFADNKILFSSYTDIKITGKARSSINGDGTRTFALIYSESSCAATTAWTFMLDYGSVDSPCTFDQYDQVTTKPYFLYSTTDVYGSVTQPANSLWDQTNFPFAEVMAIFIKGWYPVLKFANMDLSPATGIYDLWQNTYTLNEYNDTDEAFSFNVNTMTYKSSLVDIWITYYIRAVRLSFYTSGSEAQYIVFDGHASSKTSWFSCDRILYTSWADLNRYAQKDYCSVLGYLVCIGS